jgi:hypothetical protein
MASYKNQGHLAYQTSRKAFCSSEFGLSEISEVSQQRITKNAIRIT